MHKHGDQPKAAASTASPAYMAEQKTNVVTTAATVVPAAVPELLQAARQAFAQARTHASSRNMHSEGANASDTKKPKRTEPKISEIEQYDIVIQYTQQIIVIEPDNAAAYFLLAKAYHHKRFNVFDAEQRRHLNQEAVVNLLLAFHHDPNHIFAVTRFEKKIIKAMEDENALEHTQAQMDQYNATNTTSGEESSNLDPKLTIAMADFYLLRSKYLFNLGDYTGAYNDAELIRELFYQYLPKPISKGSDDSARYIQALMLCSFAASARGNPGDHDIAIERASEAHNLDRADCLPVYALGYAYYFKYKQDGIPSSLIDAYLKQAERMPKESVYALYCKDAANQRMVLYKADLAAYYYTAQKHLTVAKTDEEQMQQAAIYLAQHATNLFYNEQVDEAWTVAQLANEYSEHQLAWGLLSSICLLRGQYSTSILYALKAQTAAPQDENVAAFYDEIDRITRRLFVWRQTKKNHQVKPSGLVAQLAPKSIDTKVDTPQLNELRLLFQQGNSDPKKYGQLIDRATRMLKTYPDNADVMHLLSKALLKSGEIERAHTMAYKAFAASPMHKMCCGNALMQEAQTLFREDLSFNMAHEAITKKNNKTLTQYLQRGAIYGCRKDYKNAYEDAKRACQLPSDSMADQVQARILLSISASRLGLHEEALAAATTAYNLDKEDVSTIETIALVHYFKGEKEKHSEYLNDSQQADAESKYKVTRRLVELFIEDGNVSLVETEIAAFNKLTPEQCTAVEPPKRQQYVTVFVNRAENLLRNEFLVDARRFAEQALRLMQDPDPEVYILLCRISLRENNRQDALKYALDAARAAFDQGPETCRMLIECLRPYPLVSGEPPAKLEVGADVQAFVRLFNQTNWSPTTAATAPKPTAVSKSDHKSVEWDNDVSAKLQNKAAKAEAQRKIEAEKRAKQKAAKADREAQAEARAAAKLAEAELAKQGAAAVIATKSAATEDANAAPAPAKSANAAGSLKPVGLKMAASQTKRWSSLFGVPTNGAAVAVKQVDGSGAAVATGDTKSSADQTTDVTAKFTAPAASTAVSPPISTANNLLLPPTPKVNFKIYTLGTQSFLNPIAKDAENLAEKMKEDPSLILQLVIDIRHSKQDAVYTANIAIMKSLVSSIVEQYHQCKPRLRKIICTALTTEPFVETYARFFELDFIEKLFPQANRKLQQTDSIYLKFLFARLEVIGRTFRREEGADRVLALFLAISCHTPDMPREKLFDIQASYCNSWGTEVFGLQSKRDLIIGFVHEELAHLCEFMKHNSRSLIATVANAAATFGAFGRPMQTNAMASHTAAEHVVQSSSTAAAPAL